MALEWFEVFAKPKQHSMPLLFNVKHSMILEWVNLCPQICSGTLSPYSPQLEPGYFSSLTFRQVGLLHSFSPGITLRLLLKGTDSFFKRLFSLKIHNVHLYVCFKENSEFWLKSCNLEDSFPIFLKFCEVILHVGNWIPEFLDPLLAKGYKQ